MSNEQPPPFSLTFAEVMEEELKLIRLRRREILREERVREGRDGHLEEDGGVPTGVDDPALPANGNARLTRARLNALDEHLTGISFTGGGIRSGTFAVGILQGLAALGLLRRFDYLSTVSGGGYAGGWLAAWLKRDGDVRNVERQLTPSRVEQARSWREVLNPPPEGGPYPSPTEPPKGPVVDEESEPVYHLRAYSSYMVPRFGLLTADTWTILVIWARNVSVNMLMFLPLAMVLVLAVRLLVNFSASLTSDAIARNPDLQRFSFVPLILGVVLLLGVSIYNGIKLGEFRGGRPKPRSEKEREKGAAGIYYWLVYPILAADLLLYLGLLPALYGIGRWAEQLAGKAQEGRADILGWAPNVVRSWVIDRMKWDLGFLGLTNVVFHAVLAGLAMMIVAVIANAINGSLWDRKWLVRWKYLFCTLIAGATAGVLLAVVESVLSSLSNSGLPDLAALAGVPALLMTLAASLLVEVALLGRTISEAEREWWSRFGALITIAGLLWVIVFGTVLYVPAAFIGIGVPLRIAVTSGWLATTVAGIVAGRSAAPRAKGGPSALGLIAAVAPPVFLIGLLGLVALLASYLVNDPQLVFPPRGSEAQGISNYLSGVRNAPITSILLWFALFAVLGWIGSSFIDVNLFSLNAMYANRLVRAYLGASRPKVRWDERWGRDDPAALSGAPTEAVPPSRNENPVTGFDPEDDLDLFDLRIGQKRADGTDRAYWGPHLLLNTTLNLVGGHELAWRNRKGESFVLSPLYCGAKGTGYALVSEETRERLTLGRAMSISGAAVDPNMKYYQSASLTAFLTIMNARLGYWMQNPDHRSRDAGKSAWTAASPKYGDLLLTEFFGRTVGTGEFVHLSDGGHFDNMGVYELIRRRCRYIVACDAGEDSGPSDDNLAILMRLVRIDFGVRIELDTAPLVMQGDDKLTRVHVVVGRVRYDDVDNGQLPGVIVYIKISMTGDEPPDIQQYARVTPDFPHQPTDLTQSFDEDQFESYRALGDHIARVVFEDAAHKVRKNFWTSRDPRQEFPRGNRRLFSAVQDRWAEPPADEDAHFQQSTLEWKRLQRDLRSDPNLADLARDIYPELKSRATGSEASPPDSGDGHQPPPPSPESVRAELHTVGQMLQIMEDAWMELGLAGNTYLPMNRGWMNVFRRWVGTEALGRYWPILRSEFNPDFVQFCETELHLTTAGAFRPRLSDVSESRRTEYVASLAAEHGREWPGQAAKGRGLAAMIGRAETTAWGESPSGPAWIILQPLSGVRGDAVPPSEFPCGIVLLMAEANGDGDAIPRNYELFAWVRGAYRSIGLGSEFIGPVIEEVRAVLSASLAGRGGKITIRVRYPKSGRDGDDDMERTRWLNFFSLFDFKPESPRSASDPTDSVCYLKIEDTTPNPRP